MAATYPATQCPADRYGTKLNCTANDVVFAGNPSASSATSCVVGSTVTLDLAVTVQAGSSTRYNLGLYIGNDGKDIQALSSAGGDTTCSNYVFPLTPSPPWQNLDGNVCGDVNSATGTATYTYTGVKLKCTPGPDGYVLAPMLISWDQSSGTPTSCVGNTSTAPGTTSKCNASNTTVVANVITKASLTIKKVATGGATASFPFTATGSGTVTDPSGATKSSFSLNGTGGATTQQQLVVPYSGATPTAQIVVTEGATTGWSFASASCVDDTTGTTASYVTVDAATKKVTASFSDTNQSATCTFTNTAAPVTTYTVTYNGNGNTSGTAPTDPSSPYNSGATVTVLNNTNLVKTGYTFAGWNTAADGSGTNYAAGSTFAINANTTLYAKWTPAGAPNLTINKTHAGNFTQGQTGATYTITVGNSGGAATSGTITVSDTLPTGLTFVSGTGTGWSCGASGQTVTCTSSTVIAASGTGSAITLTVNVAANAAASVTNTATATGGGATNTASHSDPTTITPVSPTLAITKTHSGNFTQGQTAATYTITVSNSGGAATSGTITVTDTLPTGLTFVSGTGTGWTCSASGQAVTCTSSTAIAAGASGNPITLTVSVAANAPSLVDNTATASGGGAINTPSATDPTIIQQSAPSVLAINKAHDNNFTQGQTGAIYRITVSNAGTGSTSGTITVTDTLPTGLTYVSAAGTGWTCSASGQAVTCTSSAVITSGASGNPITLTVNVAANAPASVTNTASATGGGATNTATHDDPTTITPVLPVLTIDKRHAGDFAQGQSGATYTISVANSGAVATSGAITVSDTLPTGLTFVSGTGTGWTCSASGQVVTCTSSAVIAAGATGDPITLTVNVAANAPASVTNTVTASGGGASNTASHSDPTTITSSATGGSISGFVWYDLNHNGVRDPGEPPKVDWMVELLLNGQVVKSVLTNSQGNYTFTDTLPGKYTIRFTQTGTAVPGGGAVNGDPGGNGGTPSGGQLVDVNVVSGGTVTAQSLPIDPSGAVYNSSARTAIAGAKVTIGGPAGFNPLLHLAGGLATQTTAADGQYAFFLLPGAPSGTYTLTAEATGYKSPSSNIPPQSGGWPATGGSIGVYGVPTGSQPTTYFLSGPLPIADVVNNNLPLDPVVPIATVPVPTLSEWGMIVLSTLLLLAAVFEMRRRVQFRSRR